MAINENALNKGEMRKLTALRKSLGDDLANDVFAKWIARQAAGNLEAETADSVAEKLAKALKGLEKDAAFRLGNRGYTVRRARGKGAAGFIVTKND